MKFDDLTESLLREFGPAKLPTDKHSNVHVNKKTIGVIGGGKYGTTPEQEQILGLKAEEEQQAAAETEVAASAAAEKEAEILNKTKQASNLIYAYENQLNRELHTLCQADPEKCAGVKNAKLNDYKRSISSQFGIELA